MFDRPSCHAPMFHPLNALTCSVKLFLIALRSNITGQLGQKTKKQNLLCTAVPKCAYWCHPIIYIPKYFFFFVSHLYLRPQGTEVVHFLHYVASRLWCSVHQNNVGIYFKLSTTQLWAESHSGLKKTTKKTLCHCRCGCSLLQVTLEASLCWHRFYFAMLVCLHLGAILCQSKLTILTDLLH